MIHVAAMSALVVCASPVTAHCVTAEDLARGVVFEREVKGAGTAVASGGGVKVNYRAGSSSTTDVVVGPYGVFPQTGHFSDAPVGVIGVWTDANSTYSYAGRPPVPKPGKSWRTTLTFTSKGSDQSGVTKATSRYQVSYAFEGMREAVLAGCTYVVMGITGRFRGEGRDWTDRYAYFPDLGFGLLTQYTNNLTGTGARYGITSLRPAR